MLKRSLAALALVALPLFATAADFVEGKDYTLVSNPAPVEVPGKVEVREFFWYGCPHCFRLDPFVEKWLETKPAYVNFIRTPAAMNPAWEINARGFYVAQMLGKDNVSHVPMFNAIHVQKQDMNDPDSLARFYAGYGIDAGTFTADYNSFGVIGKIARSKQLAQQFQLDGVPAMVVDGKYVVKGETSKVLDVVAYLVAKDAASLPKAAPAAAAPTAPAHKKSHKKAAATH
jgi:thiol:disulfide interchange protein DsbA